MMRVYDMWWFEIYTRTPIYKWGYSVIARHKANGNGANRNETKQKLNDKHQYNIVHGVYGILYRFEEENNNQLLH